MKDKKNLHRLVDLLKEEHIEEEEMNELSDLIKKDEDLEIFIYENLMP
jgi:hypothetical protein